MTCKSIRFFSLVLFALFLAPASAQEDATSSPPAPSAPPLNEQSATWEKLDLLLTQLEQETQNLEADSKTMQRLLAESRTELTKLYGALEESRRVASASNSLLEQSAKSLATSANYLTQESRARALELWAWRAATIGLVILNTYQAVH